MSDLTPAQRSALALIKWPVRYDDAGTFILDSVNKVVLDVRGWGWFQKHPNGEALQDAWGTLVADALNAAYAKEEGR